MARVSLVWAERFFFSSFFEPVFFLVEVFLVFGLLVSDATGLTLSRTTTTAVVACLGSVSCPPKSSTIL